MSESRGRRITYDPEAEVILLSVERVAEMEEFWEFMKKTRRSLPVSALAAEARADRF